MVFGRILGELMELKGVTKYRLAKDLNKSPSSISNWIDNKNYPDIETLLVLSQYFGVSTDYLLTGKQNGLPIQGQPKVYGKIDIISEDIAELARLRANHALTQRIREVVQDIRDNHD